MTSVFPAIQISVNDALVQFGQMRVAQTPGIGLQCPNGTMQNLDMTLVPASSGIIPAFPNGCSASVFIYVFAITTTDLIIKTGPGLVALPILPTGMGQLFYGLTASQISFNSVLGGRISYIVGG